MDEINATHEVSVKIAMYSDDLEKVLVMVYPGHEGQHGLPGGHLEENETPDQALLRELDEELGISLNSFEKKSFFLRSDTEGSVILAYTAVVPRTLVMSPPNPEKEFAVWMTVNELESVENISIAYKKFVMQNWPIK